MRQRWRNWRNASRNALRGGRAPASWQRQLARRVSDWALLRHAGRRFAALLAAPLALREGPLEGAQLGALTAMAARQTETAPATLHPRRLDPPPKTPRPRPGDLLPTSPPQPSARAPERQKPPLSPTQRAWAAAGAQQKSTPADSNPTDIPSARLPPETERGTATTPRLPSLPPAHIPTERLTPLLQQLAGAVPSRAANAEAHRPPGLPPHRNAASAPPLPAAAQRTWLAALSARLHRALHNPVALPTVPHAPQLPAEIAPPETSRAPWELPLLESCLPEGLLWQLAKPEGIPPAARSAAPTSPDEAARRDAGLSEMAAAASPAAPTADITAKTPLHGPTLAETALRATIPPPLVEHATSLPLAPAPPTLPPLIPAQSREERAFPVSTLTILQAVPHETASTEPEDLEALADRIQRILAEEARRHGIDV